MPRNSPTSYKKPIRVECGAVGFVELLVDDGFDLENVTLAFDDETKQMVMRFRLKCLHHSHGADGGDPGDR